MRHRKLAENGAMRIGRGFTLVELVVTIAIVGILVAIALPSYQNHVRKANRAQAQQFMLDLANREEQVYLDLRQYVAVTATANFINAPTNASPGLNVSVPAEVTRYYTLAIGTPAGPPPSYVITAAPNPGTNQASDGTLTLDSGTGIKKRTVGSTDYDW
jgi:type IV pilus assembly protein PilE